MNKSRLILVYFNRQMTESEFFDAMSEVYERNSKEKFFVDGIHSVVARNILDSGREDDTISLIATEDCITIWDGYCSLSWYKEHGYERAPVYTIDEFIDVFRPDLREPIIFEDELMALIGG